MGLPYPTPSVTENRVSDAPAPSPPTGRPQPCPSPSITPSPTMDYPPPRGVPWKCIATMVLHDKSCPGCHFNKPDDSPHLKLIIELKEPEYDYDEVHSCTLLDHIIANAEP